MYKSVGLHYSALFIHVLKEKWKKNWENRFRITEKKKTKKCFWIWHHATNKNCKFPFSKYLTCFVSVVLSSIFYSFFFTDKNVSISSKDFRIMFVFSKNTHMIYEMSFFPSVYFLLVTFNKFLPLKSNFSSFSTTLPTDLIDMLILVLYLFLQLHLSKFTKLFLHIWVFFVFSVCWSSARIGITYKLPILCCRSI